MLAIEQNVGARIVDVLQQFFVDRREAGERVLDALAELLHLLLLHAWPHELRRRRKRHAAQRVFRVVMRRRNIQLGVRAHLRDLSKDGLTVARSEARVDDHRRPRADDDADVGHQADVAVRNGVHVARYLDGRVLFDQRRRRLREDARRQKRHQRRE